MTAGELRRIATAGSVMACSPVVIQTADGRRFEVIGRTLTCPAKVHAETGAKKPAAVPVMTVTLKEVN